MLHGIWGNVALVCKDFTDCVVALCVLSGALLAFSRGWISAESCLLDPPPQAAAPRLRLLRLEAMGIHYCGACVWQWWWCYKS